MAEIPNIAKQWGFARCVEHAFRALPESEHEPILEDPRAQMEYGRWIRNTCGLWEFGTNVCAAEIAREYTEGRLKSKLLDENRFDYPGIPFKIENTRERVDEADYSLMHPDNCSAIIMEAVFTRIRDGG